MGEWQRGLTTAFLALFWLILGDAQNLASSTSAKKECSTAPTTPSLGSELLRSGSDETGIPLSFQNQARGRDVGQEVATCPDCQLRREIYETDSDEDDGEDDSQSDADDGEDAAEERAEVAHPKRHGGRHRRERASGDDDEVDDDSGLRESRKQRKEVKAPPVESNGAQASAGIQSTLLSSAQDSSVSPEEAAELAAVANSNDEDTKAARDFVQSLMQSMDGGESNSADKSGSGSKKKEADDDSDVPVEGEMGGFLSKLKDTFKMMASNELGDGAVKSIDEGQSKNHSTQKSEQRAAETKTDPSQAADKSQANYSASAVADMVMAGVQPPKGGQMANQEHTAPTASPPSKPLVAKSPNPVEVPTRSRLSRRGVQGNLPFIGSATNQQPTTAPVTTQLETANQKISARSNLSPPSPITSGAAPSNLSPPSPTTTGTAPSNLSPPSPTTTGAAPSNLSPPSPTTTGTAPSNLSPPSPTTTGAAPSNLSPPSPTTSGAAPSNLSPPSPTTSGAAPTSVVASPQASTLAIGAPSPAPLAAAGLVSPSPNLAAGLTPTAPSLPKNGVLTTPPVGASADHNDRLLRHRNGLKSVLRTPDATRILRDIRSRREVNVAPPGDATQSVPAQNVLVLRTPDAKRILGTPTEANEPHATSRREHVVHLRTPLARDVTEDMHPRESVKATGPSLAADLQQQEDQIIINRRTPPKDAGTLTGQIHMNHSPFA